MRCIVVGSSCARVPMTVDTSRRLLRYISDGADRKWSCSTHYKGNKQYCYFVFGTTLWGIKNCTLLTGTITLQNYAILRRFLAHRCTREYPIASLFDSLCKIENWEPTYQICYCLLSSRQQRKMWNSCCNARPQTSLLQNYGLLTVLTLVLWITGYGVLQ